MINTFENKLHALKIPGRVISVSDNEFYTCYHVVFNPDITLNKIKARRADISLFFGGSADIETDGGGVIIKVLKQSRDIIGLYDFTCEMSEMIKRYEIPLIIGQTENGQKLFYDLTTAPHILAGGSTGSGKSVFMHNLIISTFYAGNANLILIDLKRVEFSIYEDIPHLATPICYDSKTAYKTLKNLNAVMTSRYETLKSAKCRNLKEYRDGGGDMNYLVVLEICLEM